MKGVVKLVEISQDLGFQLLGPFLLLPVESHLHQSAENVALLLIDLLLATTGKQDEAQGQEKN